MKVRQRRLSENEQLQPSILGKDGLPVQDPVWQLFQLGERPKLLWHRENGDRSIVQQRQEIAQECSSDQWKPMP